MIPPPLIGRLAAAVLFATAVPLSGCAPLSRPPTAEMAVPLGLELFFSKPGGAAATPRQVQLGRQLFFDPLLSRDRTVSCANCHRPELAFADTTTRSVGVQQRTPARNTPSLLNVRYRARLAWDGGSSTLEEQVLKPIEHPQEMDLPLDSVTARLRQERRYRTAFGVAFEEAPSTQGVARAISAYLRTLGSGNSRVDRFIHGQADALDPEERRGFEIFTGKARCSSCHAGPAFSDSEFHNTGGTARSGDPGRVAVTGSERDRGAFATPSLRNVSRTAPYMHDGGLPTLEAVIDFYAGGGLPNAALSARIRPIQLASSEKAALIAFLRALEGE